MSQKLGSKSTKIDQIPHIMDKFLYSSLLSWSHSQFPHDPMHGLHFPAYHIFKPTVWHFPVSGEKIKK